MVQRIWLVGLASVAVSMFGAAGAAAQYFDDGYRRGYDRGYSRGYERGYERPSRYERGYDRGYDDRRGYGPRQQMRSNDPMAGMSLEERKQAIKNHREAQKKAIKRGYVIP